MKPKCVVFFLCKFTDLVAPLKWWLGLEGGMIPISRDCSIDAVDHLA